jgi:hypothetical protein
VSCRKQNVFNLPERDWKIIPVVEIDKAGNGMVLPLDDLPLSKVAKVPSLGW